MVPEPKSFVRPRGEAPNQTTAARCMRLLGLVRDFALRSHAHLNSQNRLSPNLSQRHYDCSLLPHVDVLGL